MRRFIVVSHAYMAKGMVSSLEFILGKQEQVSWYCAYVEPGVVYKYQLLKEIDGYSGEDEIILMTDLFGGSVNNELSELMNRGNVHLICGINLILLISMVVASTDDDIAEVIRRNIEEAKQGMIYCNDVKKEKQVLLDDF